ncbi:glycosyltransferase family 4 protein [Thalassospira sp. HF15]|uniref:glycosyltransferase family 4 protein n=1 Tax=Thalassospira sp. HF15 TaxID=2722755 RepID=UPI001430C083|nr:glycosyltransferase family 4 protein [Thalassospira sp. HF15]NIY75443.1 glycosyltransferase family 4 protein [Thalassospira sp. HF15]
MSSSIDPLRKRILRTGWTSLQTLLAILPGKSKTIAVWYGGAIAGDVGGPLVKVKRLQKYFPETRIGYSIVYALSNTPYLSSFALKVLRRREIPVVLNQNGVYYSGWFDGDWEEKNRQMSRAWHAADYVFCQSKFCRECAEQFLGKRSGPTEILFNAVDIDHFSPLSEAELLSRDGTRPVLLLTGKIDDHMFYRIEATVRGFHKACLDGLDADLRLSGWMSANATEMTLGLVRQLGIEDRVILTGRYRQEDAPDIYRAGDIYIMLKHNDPCPNTVIEAMACGLPVLYSASGGVPELATGMAGRALPVEQGFDSNHVPTVQDIADGMIDIVRDLPERRRAARERAENAFDLRKWIERHQFVFKSFFEK